MVFCGEISPQEGAAIAYFARFRAYKCKQSGRIENLFQFILKNVCMFCAKELITSNEMDYSLILDKLKKVEHLKCSVCLHKCVNPVKLKVCGHYFCLKCLNIRNQLCPKCKVYCEKNEIDYNNIAKQCRGPLLELKGYLLDSEQSKRSTSNYTECKNADIFEYNNKTFHMNYIDNIPSKVNAKGETPLHIACKKKKLNELLSLITSKIDLNAKDFAGWSPLHEAVESQNAEIVETLLKNGAFIDIPGEEYTTPLHKAVNLQNAHLIRMLLTYRANKEIIDFSGRKAIDYTLNEEIKSIFYEQLEYIYRPQELFSPRNITVYFYYIEKAYQQKLMKCELVRVLNEYDANNVTHFLIRKTHKLSINIMVAMLNGCFLLPQEWIDDFLRDRYFFPISDYIFISRSELNNGIRKAVLNYIMKLPKLFDGLNFFIHGHFSVVHIRSLKFTKESISLLITSGGGKILHRAPTPSTCENLYNYPYHSNLNGKTSRCCHYLIYEETNPPKLQYQMAEIKHRTSKWLIDCIINFTICD